MLPLRTVGWLSQNTMAVLRERWIKRLQAADRHRRFRCYYPYVPGLGEQCVNVHAKVMVMDEEWVRVGSANLNNRSMGLDSECDLALEARGARVCSAIASYRDRLLAEHLRGEGRSLRELPLQVTPQLDALVPDGRIAGPERPVDADGLAEQFVAEPERTPARRALLTLAAMLVVGLLLAAGWRWTPLGDWVDVRALAESAGALRSSWVAPFAVSRLYILAGLVAFPVTLLIVGTGLAFGAVQGFIYALLGAELSALVTYGLGKWLGRDTLERLSGRWVHRVSRRLARQGLLAIVTLRVVPVAPFSVINFVAGTSHIRLRDARRQPAAHAPARAGQRAGQAFRPRAGRALPAGPACTLAARGARRRRRGADGRSQRVVPVGPPATLAAPPLRAYPDAAQLPRTSAAVRPNPHLGPAASDADRGPHARQRAGAHRLRSSPAQGAPEHAGPYLSGGIVTCAAARGRAKRARSRGAWW